MAFLLLGDLLVPLLLGLDVLGKTLQLNLHLLCKGLAALHEEVEELLGRDWRGSALEVGSGLGLLMLLPQVTPDLGGDLAEDPSELEAVSELLVPLGMGLRRGSILILELELDKLLDDGDLSILVWQQEGSELEVWTIDNHGLDHVKILRKILDPGGKTMIHWQLVVWTGSAHLGPEVTPDFVAIIVYDL